MKHQSAFVNSHSKTLSAGNVKMVSMKKILTYILVLSCFLFLPVQAEGETPTPEPTATATAEPVAPAVDISASGAVLIDSVSGSVLFESNSDAHLDPASLTKIMSVYLACTKLDVTATVTMSDTAFQTYSHDSGVLWIKSGESMTALAAEYASLLYSANDTTAMLAEAVSDDQDTFVTLMNSTAASLGMGNTNFQNIFGLNNENNYSSAADLAKLVQAAIKNVTFKKIFESAGYVMEATNMTESRPIGNDCEFLPGQDNAYENATGCKIGSTVEGGYALAASAESNGTSLIAVVLGETDEATAYADAQKLFEYGFNNYHTVTLSGADVGTKTIEVYVGKKHNYDVEFTSNSEFSILLPASIDKSQITMDMVTANEDSEDPNQITASVVFSIDGKEIGSVPMTAKITDVSDQTKEEKKSEMELYFGYFCIAILGMVILYDIARRISPPVE